MFYENICRPWADETGRTLFSTEISGAKFAKKDLVGAIDRNRPGGSGEPPLPCDQGPKKVGRPLSELSVADKFGI